MVRAFSKTFADWPPDNVLEVTMIETLVDGSKLITVQRPACPVCGSRGAHSIGCLLEPSDGPLLRARHQNDARRPRYDEAGNCQCQDCVANA